MNFSNNEQKTINKLLFEYLNKHNISNKKIAEEFGYSPAAISEYLSGKKVKDSKLNVISTLYLQIKATEKGDIIFGEKTKYEDIIRNQEKQIIELKAEVSALNKLIDILDRRMSDDRKNNDFKKSV